MKVKLLKKLRIESRMMINIFSIEKTNGITTGISYSYDSNEYSNLSNHGDTEEDVLKKVEHIYIQNYLEKRRKLEQVKILNISILKNFWM